MTVLALRRLPRWRRGRVLACAVAVVPALLVWQLWPGGSVPPPAGLRITFLDVGQGDAVLIQVPEGAVLVDQGPPEAGVSRQLRELGIRSLAALVLTHPERDHVGGAEDVIRHVRVERILDPLLAVGSAYETAAMSAANERGIPVIETRKGASWQLGRLRLRVLWPNRPGEIADDPNRLAVVVLATYGTVDALLTADAETDVTAPLLARRVEILKVAHHGSADEGLAAELRQLRPAVAVISTGRSNRYGHPTPETLSALSAVPGLRLYRTDVHGRVTIESDGRRIEVRVSR